MDNVICKVKQKFQNNKNTLLFCIVVTFIIGMITHAYMYFQDSFSHDSLREFNGNEYNEWKIQLGRFLIPIYRMFTRGNLTLPWLIGLFSLLWISLSVFLTVKLFDVKSKVFMALISGVYTANITVISVTATYIHDLDVDMFALFMSVLAVFLWCRYKKSYFLSALCVFITLGLYQCYISVTITLLIMLFILKLLRQEEFKTVFLSGIKFVSMLLVAGIVYFIALKAVMLLGNIESVSGYNTLDNISSMNFMDVKNIIKTYILTVYYFLIPNTYFPKIFVVFASFLTIGIAGFIVLFRIFSKKIGVKEKLLALTLIVILPFAMNVSQLLSGMSHALMHFALWLVYLFVLLIVYNVKDFGFKIDKKTIGSFIAKVSKVICTSILVVILFGNVICANEVYVKKDLEQDAALSYFTRVVDRMDSFDEYDRENTEVVFVGKPEIFNENMLGFSNSNYLIGVTNSYVLGTALPDLYERYFEYKLHYSIIVEYDDAEYIESDIVESMPVFPENGSLQMVNETLVVKLGEIQ